MVSHDVFAAQLSNVLGNTPRVDIDAICSCLRSNGITRLQHLVGAQFGDFLGRDRLSVAAAAALRVLLARPQGDANRGCAGRASAGRMPKGALWTPGPPVARRRGYARRGKALQARTHRHLIHRVCRYGHPAWSVADRVSPLGARAASMRRGRARRDFRGRCRHRARRQRSGRPVGGAAAARQRTPWQLYAVRYVRQW